ncbi:Protein of unknown function [Dyadobacter soli]|uniref:Outer membrane protein beta-barrel domain-containing protein n=1 Tax=Dyadobacter soli TaxID=659014 RepID=A0A1G7MFA4_9BACT|nr:DUF2490 domain-containing protein [Dyadobacter soli]SDF60381.1 Protein of unknown function [Dyadobacter soli]
MLADIPAVGKNRTNHVRNLHLLVSLCMAIAVMPRVKAQGADPYAFWLMPAVNYQISEKQYGFAQLGWNPLQKLMLGYGNFIIRPKPNFDVNIGFMYIDVTNREVEEWTLMNGFTARIPVGKMLIENRGLVWNRFITNADDMHFYRNRVRLMLSFGNASQFSPYLVDEFSYSFNRGDFSRNRIGAGCLLTLCKRVVLDVSYARQSDRISGKLNLFFIMATVRLPPGKHH